MWLRIPVTVPVTSNGLWVLDIDYPVLQRIEVYLAANGHVTQQATLGSLQPYTQRPLRSRTHALPLTMLPGTPTNCCCAWKPRARWCCPSP